MSVTIALREAGEQADGSLSGAGLRTCRRPRPFEEGGSRGLGWQIRSNDSTTSGTFSLNYETREKRENSRDAGEILLIFAYFSSRPSTPQAVGRRLFSPFSAWFTGGATISRPWPELIPDPSQNRTSGFPNIRLLVRSFSMLPLFERGSSLCGCVLGASRPRPGPVEAAPRCMPCAGSCG